MALDRRSFGRGLCRADEFADIVEAEGNVNDDLNRETNFPTSGSDIVKFYSAEIGSARTEYPSPTVNTDADLFRCRGCGVDTDKINEYYMVQFDLWKSVVPASYHRDVLCIGCLEDFLGRELVTSDFIEVPANYIFPKSERLRSRMGSRFSISPV